MYLPDEWVDKACSVFLFTKLHDYETKLVISASDYFFIVTYYSKKSSTCKSDSHNKSSVHKIKKKNMVR